MDLIESRKTAQYYGDITTCSECGDTLTWTQLADDQSWTYCDSWGNATCRDDQGVHWAHSPTLTNDRMSGPDDDRPHPDGA